MILAAGKNLYVECALLPNAGTSWVVRLCRKSWFRTRIISSDWFLDGDQAKRFAESLAAELRAGGSINAVRQRLPGWTLHRP